MTVPDTGFDRNGYVVIPGLIPIAAANALQLHVRRLARNKETAGDSQVPGTPFFYGVPAMEQLLDELLPAVEKASARELYPTYSYCRVYKQGDALARHKDRPSCEISVSLCLGSKGGDWPLFVEGPNGVSAAELAAGDGLLYKGTECPHWREPFTGEWMVQVFLHYVDQRGPHAQMRFDQREALNLPANPIRILPPG